MRCTAQSKEIRGRSLEGMDLGIERGFGQEETQENF
jgi:hypothetical protein